MNIGSEIRRYRAEPVWSPVPGEVAVDRGAEEQPAPEPVEDPAGAVTDPVRAADKTPV